MGVMINLDCPLDGFKSPWKQISSHVCVGYRLMRLAEMLRLTLCMVGTISTSWGRSEWIRCELSISIQRPLLPSCACNVTSYFTLLPPCFPHQAGLCPFVLPAEISLSQCFFFILSRTQQEEDDKVEFCGSQSRRSPLGGKVTFWNSAFSSRNPQPLKVKSGDRLARSRLSPSFKTHLSCTSESKSTSLCIFITIHNSWRLHLNTCERRSFWQMT